MIDLKKLDAKALSIIQPWAECIIFHGKNVENRSWSTQIRGYVAIHASKKVEKQRYQDVLTDYKLKLDPEESSFGAILGFAKIVDVVDKKTITRKTKKWFTGEYGFVLEDVIILKKSVQVNGARKFWRLTPAVLKKCLSQMSKSDAKKLTTSLASEE